MSGTAKDGGFVLDDSAVEDPVYVLAPDGKTLVRVNRPKDTKKNDER